MEFLQIFMHLFTCRHDKNTCVHKGRKLNITKNYDMYMCMYKCDKCFEIFHVCVVFVRESFPCEPRWLSKLFCILVVTPFGRRNFHKIPINKHGPSLFVHNIYTLRMT